MTDKRILKTKRVLKESMLKLMSDMPFRKISVKEICDTADTSRITFYAHYTDKYALLEDVVRDLKDEIHERAQELHRQNEPNGDPEIFYQNVIDAVLDIQRKHTDLLTAIRNSDGMDILGFYYLYAIDSLASAESGAGFLRIDRYPIREMSAFFVAGFWSYITEAKRRGESDQELRDGLHRLIKDLVHSDIFRNNPEPEAE